MTITVKSLYAIVFGCIFVLVISYVFQPLTTLGFARPDDHWMLLKNEWVHTSHVDWAYLKGVFTRVNQIQYSPVNTLYFNLVFRINGFDPYYFHLSNLLIHVINSIMIFKLSEKILVMFSDGRNAIVAYVVSLMWSIHPLNVEPVTWVSGSKILLCTFFTLCVLICFLRGLERSGWAYFIYSACFFIISFFCKELAILTPLMCCLMAFCYYRKQGKRRMDIKLAVFLVTTTLVAIGLAVVTAHINHMNTQEYAPIASYSFGNRIFLIFYCISFYFGNLFTPMGLHYHYPYPFRPGEDMPVVIFLYVIFVIGIALLFYFFLRKSYHFPLYLLCAGIFIIQIALYIQVIPMTRPAIVADRYMYLPSFVLLLAGVHLISQRIAWNDRFSYGRYIAAGISIVFVSYFAVYSHQLVMDWASLDLR